MKKHHNRKLDKSAKTDGTNNFFSNLNENRRDKTKKNR